MYVAAMQDWKIRIKLKDLACWWNIEKKNDGKNEICLVLMKKDYFYLKNMTLIRTKEGKEIKAFYDLSIYIHEICCLRTWVQTRTESLHCPLIS